MRPTTLILDAPAPGPWNMAVDETLLEAAAAEGQCTLRFYEWEEPTLSLGYFQTYADRYQHGASHHAAVVRRHTGGGAILHDRELTYSLAVPDRHPLAIDRLGMYQAVHATLIATLAEWQITATMFEEPAVKCRERIGCDESDDAIQPAHQPFLCFERRSPGDIVVNHMKITGSAQRRCRGAVLQHGSVLLAQSNSAPELPGIAELTKKVIAPCELVDAWISRLSELPFMALERGHLTGDQQNRASELVGEKYASTLWTEYRGRV